MTIRFQVKICLVRLKMQLHGKPEFHFQKAIAIYASKYNFCEGTGPTHSEACTPMNIQRWAK